MYKASVTITKGIDMDNGRIGFLKEHEPGKDLTITEEVNISFTYVLVQCKKKQLWFHLVHLAYLFVCFPFALHIRR